MMMRDVRCQGSFLRGFDHGGVCNQLLVRVGLETTGSFEIKCKSCKQVRFMRIDQPAVARTT